MCCKNCHWSLTAQLPPIALVFIAPWNRLRPLIPSAPLLSTVSTSTPTTTHSPPVVHFRFSRQIHISLDSSSTSPLFQLSIHFHLIVYSFVFVCVRSNYKASSPILLPSSNLIPRDNELRNKFFSVMLLPKCGMMCKEAVDPWELWWIRIKPCECVRVRLSASLCAFVCACV